MNHFWYELTVYTEIFDHCIPNRIFVLNVMPCRHDAREWADDCFAREAAHCALIRPAAAVCRPMHGNASGTIVTIKVLAAPVLLEAAFFLFFTRTDRFL